MIATAARLVRLDAPLVVEEVEIGEPDPDSGEVVVEMAYAGVNPVDRYQAIGRVAAEAPLPRTLGSEGAGTVGDRVVYVGRAAIARPDAGPWSSRVIASDAALVDIPPGVPLEVAACVGVSGVTAWRCVVDVGEVTGDDRVLVLGATGGTGSAIVSLAASTGAEVVAQTGSPRKRAFLEARHPSRVVVADAGTLAGELGEWHPTVVIDPLGGAFTGAAIEALAPRGRLVLFGTSAGLTGDVPLQVLYRKGLRVLGYAGLIEPPERIADGAAKALDAIAGRRMEIPVESVLPLASVNEALDAIAERRVQGKQVLDLRG